MRAEWFLRLTEGYTGDVGRVRISVSDRSVLFVFGGTGRVRGATGSGNGGRVNVQPRRCI